MENKNTKKINPTTLFDPSPYGFIHSIAVSSPSKLCFIAGQSGGNGEDHLLSTDFRQQTKDALNNLQLVLKSHTMTIENIVKITILIVDHNEEKLETYSDEVKKLWGNISLPASTLIPVSKLALPGMLIEIDAIAVS